MKRGRWQYLLVFAMVSHPAHAHGEEILTSIYAELASIALCVTLLFMWRRVRPFRAIGLGACIVGVLFENWAVSGLPYVENRNIITAVGFIVPVAVTLLALYVAQRIASRKR